MRVGLGAIAVAVLFVASGVAVGAAKAPGDDPAAHAAHEAYVKAINSNDLDT
jgi:hypothetical protein